MPVKYNIISPRDIKQQSNDRFGYKLDRRQPIRAVICDEFGNDSGSGDIWYDQSKRRVWIRELGTSSASIVFCYSLTPVIGLGVLVGWRPYSNVKEVLSSDIEFLGQTNATGTSYESPSNVDFLPGGRLQLWLQSKLIQPLATYPSTSGLVVNVVGGDYPYNGQRVTFAGQTNIDLSASQPAAGDYVFVGLYLDSASTLQTIAGASGATTPPAEPAWPDGAFRLSVVRLYNPQTKINLKLDTDADNDIFDRRMAWSDENFFHDLLSAIHPDTLPASVVAGDIIIGNATPKWARLAKGTDGHVLTLTSGLPAWAAPTGSGGWPFTDTSNADPTDADAQYATITAAIAALSAGQRLLIGTNFTEVVALSKALTLTGTTTDVTITDSTGVTTLTVSAAGILETLTINNTHVAAAHQAVKVTANNVILRRIRAMSNGGHVTRNGLVVDAATGVRADDCLFEVSGGDGTAIALQVINSGTMEVRGGRIDGGGGSLTLYVEAGSTVRLIGPTITGGAITNAGTLTGFYFNASGDLVVLGGTLLNFNDTAYINSGVWLVDASASQRIKQASLTAALTAADDGDAIQHEAGTSTGTFTIADAVSVSGSGVGETLITNTAATTDTVLTISDVNVEIYNLKVSQTGAGGAGVSHLCVLNNQTGCVLDNVSIEKITGASTTAIGFESTGGDSLLRNCKINVSAGSVTNYAVYLVTAGSTIIIEGGEITAGTIVTAHASAVLELRGVKLASGVTFDTSGGGIIKGWYLDSNNKIIILNGSHVVMPDLCNGSLDVWQRDTSFAAIATGTYTADNWSYHKVGVMVHTISQSTDVPTVAQAGRKVNYSLLADCTTIDASIAAGDFCILRTAQEGNDWKSHAQVGFPFSFWVKATKTGTYCVAFRNSGLDRSYVAEYTVSVTDTWEFKTVWVEPSPTAGTWNYTNGLGIGVTFALACGSTFHTTAGAWQTGNFLATANQVNACDDAANNFRIAVVGNVSDTDYQKQLARCLRYAYVLDNSLNTVNQGLLAKLAATVISVQLPLPVPMRTTPTLSHNITGYTGAAPGTTTIALVDVTINGFFTITGALTVSLGAANKYFALLTFAAGTSWSGTVGDLATLRVGPSVVAVISADL